MKLIPLNDGKYFAKVDDEDYERLRKRTWCYVGNRGIYSASRKHDGTKTNILMTREILHRPSQQIRHRDKDPLNNQKSNLYLVGEIK